MTGKEVRERRKVMAMTQEEFAKALGVTANTVARWERDEVAIPVLLELALKQLESEHPTKLDN